VRTNDFLFKWKYFVLITVFVSGIAAAQIFNIVPATLVLQGDYAWACFEGRRLCAKIHKDDFCLITVEREFISCEDTIVEY